MRVRPTVAKAVVTRSAGGDCASTQLFHAYALRIRMRPGVGTSPCTITFGTRLARRGGRSGRQGNKMGDRFGVKCPSSPSHWSRAGSICQCSYGSTACAVESG